MNSSFQTKSKISDPSFTDKENDEGSCPHTHPHAFRDGRACCRYGMEGYQSGNPLCANRYLRQDSTCCSQDQEVACVYRYCRDNSGRLLELNSKQFIQKSQFGVITVANGFGGFSPRSCEPL